MTNTQIRQKAESWLNSEQLDANSKEEIRRMLAGDEEELIESFYKNLEFGTGGLRGIMGVGTNRINKFTVGMATQGLSNYLLKAFAGETIKVAIAHDSRNNSELFTDVTAAVFSANGIEVYVFEDLRPTPELSFAIRKLGCKSGVVLTASHNPKEYNGYKAYWDDGAQVTPPHDKNIINEVLAIQSLDEVKFEADHSKIHSLGKEMDEAYLAMVKSLSLAPEAIERQRDLKIVYSSIHGTGIVMVPEALRRLGFENVIIVEEQANPDGNFPTVIYPNPEEREAMTLALEKAKNVDADLVMATDPDADRVALGMKLPDGEWELLNGNQTAALLTWYLLEKWKENGKLDGKQFVVSTIVTTDLIERICSAFDVKNYLSLTGFKWIAEIIRNKEGKEKYIGGGEESYGYLIGDEVRDKDAISACSMAAEMTAWFKDNGMNLQDALVEMYSRFGFFRERLVSITRKGKNGSTEIAEMMAEMRENPPATLGAALVTQLLDYQSLKGKNLQSGEEWDLQFPKSNVLQFITAEGSKISARPSGTEPKIKFYVSVSEKLPTKESYKATYRELEDRIDRIMKELKLDS